MRNEVMIRVSEIDTNEDRKQGGMGDLSSLAESMARVGLINAVTVRGPDADGRYKIIAGRRRLEAARNLGWITIRALVCDYDDYTPDREIQLAENTNRLDMHPLDEAVLFDELLQRGTPIDELALVYMRSKTAIYQRIKLANLIDPIKDLFRADRISITNAAAIACLDQTKQALVHDRIAKKNGEIDRWTVGSAIAAVENCKLNNLFPIDDTCEACQHRTRFMDATLFPDMYTQNEYCLNAACYQQRYREAINTIVQSTYENDEDDIRSHKGVIYLLESKESFLSGSQITVEVNLGSGSMVPLPFPVLSTDKYEFCTGRIPEIFDDRTDLIQTGIFISPASGSDSPVVQFVLSADLETLRRRINDEEECNYCIELDTDAEKEAYQSVIQSEDWNLLRSARTRIVQKIALEEFGETHGTKAVYDMLTDMFSFETVSFVAQAHYAGDDADIVECGSAWLAKYNTQEILAFVYDCVLYNFLSRLLPYNVDPEEDPEDYRNTDMADSFSLLDRDIVSIVTDTQSEYKRLLRERVDAIVAEGYTAAGHECEGEYDEDEEYEESEENKEDGDIEETEEAEEEQTFS